MEHVEEGEVVPIQVCEAALRIVGFLPATGPAHNVAKSKDTTSERERERDEVRAR